MREHCGWQKINATRNRKMITCILMEHRRTVRENCMAKWKKFTCDMFHLSGLHRTNFYYVTRFTRQLNRGVLGIFFFLSIQIDLQSFTFYPFSKYLFYKVILEDLPGVVQILCRRSCDSFTLSTFMSL